MAENVQITVDSELTSI